MLDRNATNAVVARPAELQDVKPTTLPACCENPGDGGAPFEKEDAKSEFDVAMSKVAQHTHCFPEEWKGKCHTHEVSDAFSRAYRYKFWLFVDEIASVVLAPLVLCFSLPRCANDIVLFVEEHTIEVEGFGRLLHHSLFDFVRYGDPRYGGAKPGANTIPTVSGKMEKSFLNFKLSYPECDFDEANEVLDNVSGMVEIDVMEEADDEDERKSRDSSKRKERTATRRPRKSKLAMSLERMDQIVASRGRKSRGHYDNDDIVSSSRHDVPQHETELV